MRKTWISSQISRINIRILNFSFYTVCFPYSYLHVTLWRCKLFYDYIQHNKWSYLVNQSLASTTLWIDFISTHYTYCFFHKSIKWEAVVDHVSASAAGASLWNAMCFKISRNGSSDSTFLQYRTANYSLFWVLPRWTICR